MKFIKSYKIFENIDSDESYILLKEDIEDILNPLSDRGYNIEITPIGTSKLDRFPVLIIRIVSYLDKPLNVLDYKIEFDRLYNLLIETGYNNIIAKYVGRGRYRTGVLEINYQDFIKRFELLGERNSNLINLLFIVNDSRSGKTW